MLVVAELIINWMLICLIWLVQLVHYPSFRFIARAQFAAFHQHHTSSITLVVMPLMLAELGVILWQLQANTNLWVSWVSLLLVIAIWSSTFLVQVPLHNQLALHGYQEVTIGKLIHTNWWRTLLWTAKGILLTYTWLKIG